MAGKPRQRLRHDPEALSAVVGTILLIAIAFVLAAAIWFTVNRLQADEIKDPPEVGFLVVANEPSVRVVTAPAPPEELDWFRDLRIRGTCEPTLNGNAFPTAEGVKVLADDVLGCEWGERLRISASPDRGHAMIFRHDFPA